MKWRWLCGALLAAVLIILKVAASVMLADSAPSGKIAPATSSVSVPEVPATFASSKTCDALRANGLSCTKFHPVSTAVKEGNL